MIQWVTSSVCTAFLQGSSKWSCEVSQALCRLPRPTLQTRLCHSLKTCPHEAAGKEFSGSASHYIISQHLLTRSVGLSQWSSTKLKVSEQNRLKFLNRKSYENSQCCANPLLSFLYSSQIGLQPLE